MKAQTNILIFFSYYKRRNKSVNICIHVNFDEKIKNWIWKQIQNLICFSYTHENLKMINELIILFETVLIIYNWLKIIVIRFKYIKICNIIITHMIFAKIKAAELKMLIFVT